MTTHNHQTRRQQARTAQVDAQYFSTGVAALLRIAPYYATLVAQLVRRPVEAPGLTLAVSDDGFLFYSPTWLKTLTLPQLLTAIEHELLHILMRTAARGQVIGALNEHERTIWNYATDCANNESLKGAKGRELGQGWLLPETFGMAPRQTAEIYYGELMRKAPPPPQPQRGPGEGKCGSCGGVPHEVESDEKIRGTAKGRTAVEMDLARRQVAREIEQAQRTRGDVPGALARWASDMLTPPKIDWRTHLARLVRANAARAVGASDLDWLKVSRRQYGIGIGAGRAVLPAYTHRIPRVAVIVDTSGSMSKEDLAAAVAEVDGITRAIGADVEFLAIDAALHVVTKVRNARDAAKNLKGGGGTNMQPAIAELAQRARAKRPDIAICLTDGEIGDIGPKPPFTFIWATINTHSDFDFAWGSHIVVESKPKKAGAQ